MVDGESSVVAVYAYGISGSVVSEDFIMDLHRVYSVTGEVDHPVRHPSTEAGDFPASELDDDPSVVYVAVDVGDTPLIGEAGSDFVHAGVVG